MSRREGKFITKKNILDYLIGAWQMNARRKPSNDRNQIIYDLKETKHVIVIQY